MATLDLWKGLPLNKQRLPQALAEAAATARMGSMGMGSAVRAEPTKSCSGGRAIS